MTQLTPAPMTREVMFGEANIAELAALPVDQLNLRLMILRRLEVENATDPRLGNEGGVRDQIKALDIALVRKTGKPSSIVIGMQTLKLHAERPALGE